MLPAGLRVKSFALCVIIATGCVASASASVPDSFDARYVGEDAVASAKTLSAPEARLAHSLGSEGVLDIDPTTGTPRVVADRDGALTGPSENDPEAIALGYVADNPATFGLDAGEIGDLDLSRRYASNGITHLIWGQQVDGVGVFHAGVRASVAEDGRLMTVGGAPVADLPSDLPDPGLGAAAALKRSTPGPDSGVGGVDSVRGPDQETEFGEGATARLVFFPDEDGGARLAWRTMVPPGSPRVWDSAVDASTGELLHREDRLDRADGLAYDNFPGAASGGTQTTKTFSTPPANDPWITDTTQLKGNNAWTYMDENDNRYTAFGGFPFPTLNQEIPPETGSSWSYEQVEVTSDNPGQLCPATGCTWAGWDFPDDVDSWETNANQAGTQAFYFANTFHDHLRDATGIGFDEASGNFEQVNSSNAGQEDDPAFIQVVDGADGVDEFDPEESGALKRDAGDGLPDGEHRNNGIALTLSDGNPLRIELFLFSDNEQIGFEPGVIRDVNGADIAPLVYHEYTHGMTARLVTDEFGDPALTGDQSDAMQEAWSDWYAMDYLVAQGFQPDTAANGEVFMFPYSGIKPTEGRYRGRSEALDCPVGSTAPQCPGSTWDEFDDFDAGPGGYTYGDFARVRDLGPQVHHDGEIWGQTLWDLRRELIVDHGATEGLNRARALVTEGTRMAPVNPTYLDVRNAILLADSALGFDDHDLIWDVFADRGMGFEASTEDSFDTSPVEDFSVPADGVDPETTIVKVKVNRKKRKATLTLSGTDPDPASLPLSFQCRIDAKPFEPCGTTKTFSKMKKGSHTAEAFAYDAAFNADPTPALKAFRVKKP